MRKFEKFIMYLFYFTVFSIFIALDLYDKEYNFILVYIVFLIFLPFMIYTDISHDNNKKPVKCIKAKLNKTTFQTGAVHYGVFLLSDGSKIKLIISLHQYLYFIFNKNDNVTLMYQGWLAHSIKKDTDKIPLFNEEYSSGKKFAKYAFKYPLQSAKAKVVSKAYGDSVIFLLPDKSKIEMTVSKKQYKALKKGDMIDIIYQGWILHYIKKDEYEKAIFNEDFSSKKLLIEYMSKK